MGLGQRAAEDGDKEPVHRDRYAGGIAGDELGFIIVTFMESTGITIVNFSCHIKRRRLRVFFSQH